MSLWKGEVCHIPGCWRWAKRRTCAEGQGNQWLTLHCLPVGLHSSQPGWASRLWGWKMKTQRNLTHGQILAATGCTETTLADNSQLILWLRNQVRACAQQPKVIQTTGHETWLPVLLKYTWKILLLSVCLIRYLNVFGIWVLSLLCFTVPHC